MPFYNCIHRDQLLTDPQKRLIAQEITRIHCEATGAPSHFVHVVFQAYRNGDCYTGGEISKVVNIRGNIRLGRSQETKESILRKITNLWQTLCPDTELGSIVVSLTENPGTNVMEGGIILPHPKDDDVWLAENGFVKSA